MRGVIINKGLIGVGAALNLDSISALLVNGPAVAVSEGVTGVENGSVYLLERPRDAELLGIDEAYDTDNDVRVYRHISEFYRMAGEGTKLYIMVCAEATDMATMLGDISHTLVSGAEGRIRRLAVAYNPGSDYTPVVLDGMEEVVRNAIAPAQALHDWSWNTDRPLNVFIEGRGIADSVAGTLNLKAIQVESADVAYPNVSICIGQDWDYANGLTGAAQKMADVGTMLGTSALIDVNRSIGEVETLDLADANKSKWLTAGLSNHKKISAVESDLDTYDLYGYVFAINYTGLTGFRWNNDHVCAPEVIDEDGYLKENSIALGLTFAKAARRLRTALLPKVKTVVPVDTKTGLLPTGIRKYFEGIGDSEFAAMVTAGEISGGKTNVDPDSNLLTGDKALKVSFTIVPTGTINEIQGSINLNELVMSLITRNGKAYDGGDVHIAMFGSLSYEVTELTYGTEQEHQPNHSLGSNKMTSYSMGKVTNTASMTMRLASVSALEKAAGGKLLKIKPFKINVTFVNEDNDIVNDTLLVKFQSTGRDIPGDMDIKKQFTLFTLDIDYNNA